MRIFSYIIQLLKGQGLNPFLKVIVYLLMSVKGKKVRQLKTSKNYK